MKRFKIFFSYDGSDFYGLQRLPNKRTIQGTIENKLSNIDYQPIKICCSGRTDKGVHAIQQVAHFDVYRENININNLKNLLKNISDDICIYNIEEVSDDFHARYSVKMKEYIFKVKSLKIYKKTPFNSRYYTFIKQEDLDLKYINYLCSLFIGEKDFTAFSCMPKGYNCNRILYDFSCKKQNNTFIFTLRANGFLTYMVRILMGFMFSIYTKEEKVEKINQLFITKDRNYVNKKFPPQGLYLNKIIY